MSSNFGIYGVLVESAKLFALALKVVRGVSQGLSTLLNRKKISISTIVRVTGSTGSMHLSCAVS